MNKRKKIAGKCKNYVLKYFNQGMSARKLALTIAISIVAGVFPVIGVTTILCILLAVFFRLNIAAMQAINYICYPIQMCCIIPFYQFGQSIFLEPAFNLGMAELSNKISGDFFGTMLELWSATWHAIIAWSIVAPLAIIAIYSICFPLLKKIFNQKSWRQSALDTSESGEAVQLAGNISDNHIGMNS